MSSKCLKLTRQSTLSVSNINLPTKDFTVRIAIKRVDGDTNKYFRQILGYYFGTSDLSGGNLFPYAHWSMGTDSSDMLNIQSCVTASSGKSSLYLPYKPSDTDYDVFVIVFDMSTTGNILLYKNSNINPLTSAIITPSSYPSGDVTGKLHIGDNYNHAISNIEIVEVAIYDYRASASTATTLSQMVAHTTLNSTQQGDAGLVLYYAPDSFVDNTLPATSGSKKSLGTLVKGGTLNNITQPLDGPSWGVQEPDTFGPTATTLSITPSDTYVSFDMSLGVDDSGVASRTIYVYSDSGYSSIVTTKSVGDGETTGPILGLVQGTTYYFRGIWVDTLNNETIVDVVMTTTITVANAMSDVRAVRLLGNQTVSTPTSATIPKSGDMTLRMFVKRLEFDCGYHRLIGLVDANGVERFAISQNTSPWTFLTLKTQVTGTATDIHGTPARPTSYYVTGYKTLPTQSRYQEIVAVYKAPVDTTDGSLTLYVDGAVATDSSGSGDATIAITTADNWANNLKIILGDTTRSQYVADAGYQFAEICLWSGYAATAQDVANMHLNPGTGNPMCFFDMEYASYDSYGTPPPVSSIPGRDYITWYIHPSKRTDNTIHADIPDYSTLYADFSSGVTWVSDVPSYLGTPSDASLAYTRSVSISSATTTQLKVNVGAGVVGNTNYKRTLYLTKSLSGWKYTIIHREILPNAGDALVEYTVTPADALVAGEKYYVIIRYEGPNGLWEHVNAETVIAGSLPSLGGTAKSIHFTGYGCANYRTNTLDSNLLPLDLKYHLPFNGNLTFRVFVKRAETDADTARTFLAFNDYSGSGTNRGYYHLSIGQSVTTGYLNIAIQGGEDAGDGGTLSSTSSVSCTKGNWEELWVVYQEPTATVNGYVRLYRNTTQPGVNDTLTPIASIENMLYTDDWAWSKLNGNIAVGGSKDEPLNQTGADFYMADMAIWTKAFTPSEIKSLSWKSLAGTNMADSIYRNSLYWYARPTEVIGKVVPDIGASIGAYNINPNTGIGSSTRVVLEPPFDTSKGTGSVTYSSDMPTYVAWNDPVPADAITVIPLARTCAFEIRFDKYKGSVWTNFTTGSYQWDEETSNAYLEWKTPSDSTWKEAQQFVRVEGSPDAITYKSDPRLATMILGLIENETYEYRIHIDAPGYTESYAYGTFTTLDGERAVGTDISKQHTIALPSAGSALKYYTTSLTSALGPTSTTYPGHVVNITGTTDGSVIRRGLSTPASLLDISATYFGWSGSSSSPLTIKPLDGTNVIFDGSIATYDVVGQGLWEQVPDTEILYDAKDVALTIPVSSGIYRTKTALRGHRAFQELFYEKELGGDAYRAFWLTGLPGIFDASVPYYSSGASLVGGSSASTIYHAIKVTTGEDAVPTKGFALGAFRMSNVTNTTDSITGYIYSDNSGVPGTLLLTTNSKTVGDLSLYPATPTAGELSLTATNAITLTANTSYWLITKFPIATGNAYGLRVWVDYTDTVDNSYLIGPSTSSWSNNQYATGCARLLWDSASNRTVRRITNHTENYVKATVTKSIDATYPWQAMKFKTGVHSQDVGIVMIKAIKAGTITNTTAEIKCHIYTDATGVPGTPILTFGTGSMTGKTISSIRYGDVDTALSTLYFYNPIGGTITLDANTNYWVVMEGVSVAGGGSISYNANDSFSSGLWSQSISGTSWNLVNNYMGCFSLSADGALPHGIRAKHISPGSGDEGTSLFANGISSLLAFATNEDGGGAAYCHHSDGKIYLKLDNGADPNTVYVKIPYLEIPVTLMNSSDVILQNLQFQYFRGDMSYTFKPGNADISSNVFEPNLARGGIVYGGTCNNIIVRDCVFKGAANAFCKYGSGSAIKNLIVKRCTYHQTGLTPKYDVDLNKWVGAPWMHTKLSFQEDIAFSPNGVSISVLDSTFDGYNDAVAPNGGNASLVADLTTNQTSYSQGFHVDNCLFKNIMDDAFEPTQYNVNVMCTRSTMRKTYKGLACPRAQGGPVIFVRNKYLGQGELLAFTDRQAGTKLGHPDIKDSAKKLIANNTFVNNYIPQTDIHYVTNGVEYTDGVGVGLSGSGTSFNTYFYNNYVACDGEAIDWPYNFGLGYPHIFDNNIYIEKYPNTHPPFYSYSWDDSWGSAVIPWGGSHAQESYSANGVRYYGSFESWQAGKSDGTATSMPGYVASFIPTVPVAGTTSLSKYKWLHDPHGKFVPSIDNDLVGVPTTGVNSAVNGFDVHEVFDFTPKPNSVAVSAGTPLANITYDVGPGWSDLEEVNMDGTPKYPTVGALPVYNATVPTTVPTTTPTVGDLTLELNPQTGTYYFGWYFNSGGSSEGAQTNWGLHPIAERVHMDMQDSGHTYSQDYTNAAHWHMLELTDMHTAGIDIAFVDWRAYPEDYDSEVVYGAYKKTTQPSSNAKMITSFGYMLEALAYMEANNMPHPKISAFGEMGEYNINWSASQSRLFARNGLLRFYDMVYDANLENCLGTMAVDGLPRPLVAEWLFSSTDTGFYADSFSNTTDPDGNNNFKKEFYTRFGVLPYLVFNGDIQNFTSTNWNGFNNIDAIVGWPTWDPERSSIYDINKTNSSTTGFHQVTGGFRRLFEYNGFPIRDHSTNHYFLQWQLQRVCNDTPLKLVILSTWNDFPEGSASCRTAEFGTSEMEIMALYSHYIKNGTHPLITTVTMPDPAQTRYNLGLSATNHMIDLTATGNLFNHPSGTALETRYIPTTDLMYIMWDKDGADITGRGQTDVSVKPPPPAAGEDPYYYAARIGGKWSSAQIAANTLFGYAHIRVDDDFLFGRQDNNVIIRLTYYNAIYRPTGSANPAGVRVWLDYSDGYGAGDPSQSIYTNWGRAYKRTPYSNDNSIDLVIYGNNNIWDDSNSSDGWWTTHEWTLTDAVFKNMQNAGADFRIVCQSGPIWISKIEVVRSYAPAFRQVRDEQHQKKRFGKE